MELGSATVKRVTLELGGKSPSLVLPDADLALAVDGVLFGVFFNGGQSCEAGTRCFIPEHLHEEFLERLVERANSLRVGDPLDMETDIGPLVSEAQCRAVEEYIAIGKHEGALLACGGAARERITASSVARSFSQQFLPACQTVCAWPRRRSSGRCWRSSLIPA